MTITITKAAALPVRVLPASVLRLGHRCDAWTGRGQRRCAMRARFEARGAHYLCGTHEIQLDQTGKVEVVP